MKRFGINRLGAVVAHTDDVRRRAQGRWEVILGALVPEIAAALQHPGRHVTCPFHGGKADFRVTRDVADKGTCHCTCGHWDGFAILMHARNWTFQEGVAQVEAVLGGSGQRIHAPAPTSRPAAPQQDADSIQRKLQQYWGDSIELGDPKAAFGRRYLASRGLVDVEGVQDLRYHPALPFHENETSRFTAYPALLAVARMADGRVATLHRTWLTDEGQRVRVVERKLYTRLETHPVTGGAIRLFDAEGPALNVGEGLETSWSARVIAPEVPSWSCLNKELLKAVRLPDHVRVVTVFADRDRSYGDQEAAVDLVDRLRSEGRRAMMFLPPSPIPDDAKGIDWNDFLQSEGREGARNHFCVQRWKRSLAEAVASVASKGTSNQQQLR